MAGNKSYHCGAHGPVASLDDGTTTGGDGDLEMEKKKKGETPVNFPWK